MAGRHLVEQFLGAGNFCLLDGSQFQCFHRAFGFCHKENVLDGAFVECDCPVRRIVAYRRGNLEGSGQLGVDTNFLRSIQIFGKLTLNALVGRAIGKHIVLNCLLGKKRLIKALGGLFCRKDRAVVFSLNGIVGDMIFGKLSFYPKLSFQQAG